MQGNKKKKSFRVQVDGLGSSFGDHFGSCRASGQGLGGQKAARGSRKNKNKIEIRNKNKKYKNNTNNNENKDTQIKN